MNRIHKQNKGFTIMEMLGVVLIIGILSAIAIPGYRKAMEKSQLAEGVIGIRAIETAARERLMSSTRLFETYSLEDLHFSLSSGEMDGSGQWITKNWTFSIASIKDGGTVKAWVVTAQRNTGDLYSLISTISRGASGSGITLEHECDDGNTSMGRYICRYMGGDGWQ